MKILTLKAQRDFDITFKKGKSFANRNLIVYYIINKKDFNSYGIVISKKIGKAHTRNYLRRIIKENLRQMKIKNGYNILIIVRKGSHEMNFNDMKGSITHIFKKIGLIGKIQKNE